MLGIEIKERKLLLLERLGEDVGRGRDKFGFRERLFMEIGWIFLPMFSSLLGYLNMQQYLFLYSDSGSL